ncbi:hypothetical protein GCM10010307_10460 [Streptomyces vastus]|uniref:TerD domain-containing protein n=1 Tax=Streptomyces vastus TaxID=285451 RepID=A0ABN3QEF7_9ACTN
MADPSGLRPRAARTSKPYCAWRCRTGPLHLTGGGKHTALIMAKVHRTGGSWRMKAIGEPATGRTFQDLLPSIAPHL